MVFWMLGNESQYSQGVFMKTGFLCSKFMSVGHAHDMHAPEHVNLNLSVLAKSDDK